MNWQDSSVTPDASPNRSFGLAGAEGCSERDTGFPNDLENAFSRLANNPDIALCFPDEVQFIRCRLVQLKQESKSSCLSQSIEDRLRDAILKIAALERETKKVNDRKNEIGRLSRLIEELDGEDGLPASPKLRSAVQDAKGLARYNQTRFDYVERRLSEGLRRILHDRCDQLLNPETGSAPFEKLTQFVAQLPDRAKKFPEFDLGGKVSEILFSKWIQDGNETAEMIESVGKLDSCRMDDLANRISDDRLRGATVGLKEFLKSVPGIAFRFASWNGLGAVLELAERDNAIAEKHLIDLCRREGALPFREVRREKVDTFFMAVASRYPRESARYFAETAHGGGLESLFNLAKGGNAIAEEQLVDMCRRNGALPFLEMPDKESGAFFESVSGRHPAEAVRYFFEMEDVDRLRSLAHRGVRKAIQPWLSLLRTHQATRDDLRLLEKLEEQGVSEATEIARNTAREAIKNQNWDLVDDFISVFGHGLNSVDNPVPPCFIRKRERMVSPPPIFDKDISGFVAEPSYVEVFYEILEDEFKSAAETDPDAMVAFGCFLKRKSRLFDHTVERLFQKAAELENADGMNNYAVLLCRRRQYTEAKEWFEKATRKNSEVARKNLSLIRLFVP